MASEFMTSPSVYPAVRGIIAITNERNALITTGILDCPSNIPTATPVAHGYGSGLKARIIMPWGFGMPQINLMEGIITVVNSTQFTISIDTTLFMPFTIPTPSYTVSPLSGKTLAWKPYRTLDNGTSTGMLVIEQCPQIVPVGDTSVFPTLNAVRNILPN